MEQIVCSETSAIINQTPGNHPKEDILYTSITFNSFLLCAVGNARIVCNTES
jgi:hypothetical protein